MENVSLIAYIGGYEGHSKQELLDLYKTQGNGSFNFDAVCEDEHSLAT